MKSNIEYRNAAWKRLWADYWFGRLFGGGLLLSLCGCVAQAVVGGILGQLGVEDWSDYRTAVALNRIDVTTPIPNLTKDYIIRASSATTLEMFIGYIMTVIAAYGAAVIMLRCIENREEGWLGAAFGGFRDPFGLLWLFVRLVVIYLGWAVVAILPVGALACVCWPVVHPMQETSPLAAAAALTAVLTVGLSIACAVYAIPFYRYRFLFLVKADHPDWGAGECLGSCRDLMEGHKMESFRLDCSYWKSITLVLLAFLAACVSLALIFLFKDGKPVLAALAGLFGLAMLLVSIVGGIVLGKYIGVGQGFFYQDLKYNGHTAQNCERN